MTKEIQITQVVVDQNRFRRSFEDIDSLAESIQKIGLIQPIVLDDNDQLLAGERRYRAFKKLGRKTIPYVRMSELDDFERRVVELEENIKRAPLTWQEEVVAKARLHELYVEKHGKATTHKSNKGWTIQDTADHLSESYGKVAQDIELGREILERRKTSKTSDLEDKPTKSSAFKALKTQEDNDARLKVAKFISEHMKEESKVRLILGDALEETRKLDDSSVDLVVMDPPYGVQLDKKDAFVEAHGSVDTDNALGLDFLKPVLVELYRVLVDGSHMYIFHASKNYTQLCQLVESAGFTYDPIPLIWYKHTRFTQTPFARFIPDYEPILFCQKGKRNLNSVRGAVLDFHAVPTSEKAHPTEKPTGLLRELISLSSVEGELVFDPYAGSASTLVAARDVKRRALGVEKNERHYTSALARIGRVENK